MTSSMRTPDVVVTMMEGCVGGDDSDGDGNNSYRGAAEHDLHTAH